jgi:hypothetical protein
MLKKEVSVIALPILRSCFRLYFPNQKIYILKIVAYIYTVVLFAGRVFPDIKRRFRSSRFVISRSNSAFKVCSLLRHNAINVTGYVDDIRIELDKAHINRFRSIS